VASERGGVVEEPSAERVGVELPAGHGVLAGELSVPNGALGAVVFAHGSGSSRASPRNAMVAGVLQRSGLATLDLLTNVEARDRRNVFDVDLLAERLADATGWLRRRLPALPAGFFGASTGAAAALVAAAARDDISAVVSRGGRPDLAGQRLPEVRAPTLLIVGGADLQVLELNRSAARRLGGPADVEVVSGATHLFEEAGALERAAELARDWFLRWLPPGSGET
jgi:pimeloyl-ACP methyl ester carboxylesterase